MSNKQFDILRELAKRFKRRMSSATIWDGNVCAWTHPPGRSWEFMLVSGEPFSKQLRYDHRGHKVRIFTNSWFLNAQVSGFFVMEHLSVNRKDANDFLLRAAEPLTINQKQYCTFTKSGALTSRQRKLFAKTEFVAAARELDLRAQESLHFAEGSISAYFDHPSLSRVTNAVESLIDLAESLAEPAEELDLTALPVQFHPLIPS